MTSARAQDFLSHYVIGVRSGGLVGEVAGEILSALGARIVTLNDPVSDDAAPPLVCDAVVDDRLAGGCDPSYAADVASKNARVWVTVTAFGLVGPAAGFIGSDLVCAAAGGLLGAVTEGDGTPQPIPGQQGLIAIGQVAALAVLHGLSTYQLDNEPVHLDVSGQEAVAFCSVQQECYHLAYRCGGLGGALRYSAPSGRFACRDGFIRLVVIDDHQWARMAGVMGQPDWIRAYPTTRDRGANATFINQAVSEWTASQSKIECEQLLQDHGIAGTAVRSADEVVDSELFRIRSFFRRVEDGGGVVPESLPALVRRRTGSPAEPGARPMSDVRIVEIDNVLSSPLTGAILGSMGAQVVRFEDTQRPDLYRTNGPWVDGEPGPERAAYFLGANYSKRSVAGDLREDPQLVATMLDWANVILENVGERRLGKLGVVDWINSDASDRHLVVGISGFGRTEPYAAFKAYAGNVHAFSGLEGLLDETVEGETTIRSAFADYCTAIWAASFVTAWCLGGMPGGAVIDLSMAEVIAQKACRPVGSLGGGQDEGADSENLVLETSDGRYLAVSIGVDAHYDTLLTALGLQTGRRRADDRAAIGAAVRRAHSDDMVSLVPKLQLDGVAAWVCAGTQEVLDDDQLRNRGFFQTLQHPVVGPATTISLPWMVAAQARPQYQRAPLLGEHTTEFVRPHGANESAANRAP
jgi:crotonobetainyl-CoA:carnitine CoA-transferase CaiB-like acyl-CoA transferase